MAVEIIIVNNNALLKKFIYLPGVLNKSYTGFVPPFYKDEFDFHNPVKNKNLQSSDTIRLLAVNEGKIVGRIMGIIYHPWNVKMNKKYARFYEFDCINDQETADALLSSVERWATENNMTHIIGSFGFSDKDPQGIQIEGFEYPPVIASVSHQPHIANLVVNFGFEKFKDCVSYQLEIPNDIPEIYKRTYNRILKNHNLKLLEFNSRKALKPFFGPVLKLLNEGYKNIFGFIPMSNDDIKLLADQYLAVLDPQLVKLVKNEKDQPVAFVIAMANISKGIKKAKGKLFPFGFIRILMEMKTSNQLDLLLGAVSESYRGRGLTVLMGISLMATARNKGLKTIDSHLILEENRQMCAETEKLNGKLHKRYRIFIKTL